MKKPTFPLAVGIWTKPLRGRGDSRPSSLIDQ